MQEKELNRLDDWTPKDRAKIFSLWEGRFYRKEKEYLSPEGMKRTLSRYAHPQGVRTQPRCSFDLF